MAILKVANVHFDVAGSNRLEYLGNNVTRLSSNGALTLPSGTVAARPASASVGTVRFNTDTDLFEGKDSSGWQPLANTTPAFTQANISSNAYDKANSANIYADTTNARAAFANTVAIFANTAAAAAFNKANAANVYADTTNARAAFANTVAIAAFAVANTFYIATPDQFRANSNTQAFLTSDTVWRASMPVMLTDAATIAVDMDAGFDFNVTIAGARTLGNPTNAKPGQRGRIQIKQDATGSRTLAYSSYWDFAGGTAPTLTTTANAIDFLDYDIIDATNIRAALSKAWS